MKDSQQPDRKLRILLAEDSHTHQLVIRSMLKTVDCTIDAVANGADAVERVKRATFDLILMDCQMPVMDGCEAAGSIRCWEQEHAAARCPIIAMTGTPSEGDRAVCLALGMDDYLAKPIDAGLLVERIEHWTSGASGANAVLGPSLDPAPLTAPRTDKIFDRADILARMLDNQEIARVVVEAYLEEAPRLLRELQAASAAHADVETVRRLAHTLKGASAQISGDVVQAKAYELELAARAGDWTRIAARVPEVAAQVEALKLALTEFLGSLQ